MDCPYCTPEEQKGSRVMETRMHEGGRVLRRRRQCASEHQHRFTTFETVADTDALERGVGPTRRRLPAEAEAINHKFRIGMHEGYLTAVKYEDGSVGEVLLTDLGKESSTVKGLMNSLAICMSIALQYGVPLEVLVNTLSYVRFEPEGITTNPEIPFARSLPDYVVRWLASRFIDDIDYLEQLGVLTTQVRARKEALESTPETAAVKTGRTKSPRRRR